MSGADNRSIYCSFCGKSQHEVEHIVAAPGHVFICAECVSLCQEIIEEARASRRWRGAAMAKEFGPYVAPRTGGAA